MFVHNNVFLQWCLLKQCKILLLSRTSNFIHNEEFLVLSDYFEWKNPCFPYEDYSTFNPNEMTESACLSEFRFGKKRHSNAIAVFHIKFISSILKINRNTSKYIYHLRVRSLGLHSCSRNFNDHRLLGEKRKDTWFYEDKKMQRTSKFALKQWIYTCEACAFQDDVILICSASSTTLQRRNLLAALLHCTVSLPLVPDKVVVMVFKFPSGRW